MFMVPPSEPILPSNPPLQDSSLSLDVNFSPLHPPAVVSPIKVSMTESKRTPSQFNNYKLVDDVINGITAYRRGTLLAKSDIESAHHIVLVHPDNHFLLRMQWRGNFFADFTLLFGLRSAPYIFTAIAD